jgi:hypothetical protein
MPVAAATGIPAGRNAHAGDSGWVTARGHRSVWHYTRHGDVTLCGNQRVSGNTERLDAPGKSAEWLGVCKKCRERKDNSRARHLTRDYRPPRG